ncbi:MAG TPA: hypothetical protein VLH94_02370 [Spirochaetia bacterium]|nr:hypothetical protein [Spirochaetia bacterium]
MKQTQIKTTNSEISKTDDPLGVDVIANADGADELQKAFDVASATFQNTFDHQPLLKLQEIAKEIESGSMGEDAIKRFIDKFQEVTMIDGVANGKVVEGSVNNWHQKHVIRLRKQLILEHEARTASELMIIDLAINAYFRSLQTSKVYSSLMQNKDGTVNYDQLKINMLKELGKQIETASKHFTSAITLLKEMKQPRINIKVNSKQAFVGQNQQFNKNA